MLEEPSRGVSDHFVHCARLLEEMAGTVDNDQLFLAFQRGKSTLVHADHRPVQAADQKQCRGTHGRQRVHRQIGPAAARHDSGDTCIRA